MAKLSDNELVTILERLSGKSVEWYKRANPNTLIFKYDETSDIEMVFVWNNEKSWTIGTRRFIKV